MQNDGTQTILPSDPRPAAALVRACKAGEMWNDAKDLFRGLPMHPLRS
jgi:hypothetical protein